MSSLDTLTLHSIAESAQSATTRAELGDRPGAEAALARAEHRFERFQTDKPSHARVVRLAREAIERARQAVSNVDAMGKTVSRRRAEADVHAAARAVARAKA